MILSALFSLLSAETSLRLGLRRGSGSGSSADITAANSATIPRTLDKNGEQERAREKEGQTGAEAEAPEGGLRAHGMRQPCSTPCCPPPQSKSLCNILGT